MSFFLVFLVTVFLLVTYNAIYHRIRSGRTFNRLQTNIASSYIVISRRIGRSTYRAIGLAFILLTAAGAWMYGAWIVTVTLMFYIHFALRAQALIDRTQFEAVNNYGQKDPAGAYLQPLAHA
jgi:hypothetical protein